MVAIHDDAQKSDALVVGFVGACEALQTTSSSSVLLYPRLRVHKLQKPLDVFQPGAQLQDQVMSNDTVQGDSSWSLQLHGGFGVCP